MRGFRRTRSWRIARWPLGALAVAFVAIQFVPFGWWHENPPVVQDAPWPSAESAAIARTSCYSCHSNETNWPAYSYVAPFSWLVRRDVEDGRHELNFSDWSEAVDEADDAVEMIAEGRMPPSQYTLVHRDAELTDAEAHTLVEALLAMARADD
ncbi:MAG: heme-binding domain-containing protein [Ilumatobacteraceae bacterium]